MLVENGTSKYCSRPRSFERMSSCRVFIDKIDAMDCREVGQGSQEADPLSGVGGRPGTICVSGVLLHYPSTHAINPLAQDRISNAGNG
jgi:hypothetical protein